MSSTKPFAVAKRAVWEAYQQVKANRGAAGIDEETIAMFEQDLSRNLYKLWNRMSSGSYFPPPVKQVEIPKATGGTRKLGIPTVSDRIAQTVVKRIIEPILDPIFHPDSYGYRPGRSANRQLPSSESGAGDVTGWSSLTSRRPLIRSIMVSCSRLCAPTSRKAGYYCISTAG
jgi:RNA-directed DNA polymerase